VNPAEYGIIRGSSDEKRYPVGRNRFKSAPPAKMVVNTEKSRSVVNLYDNAVHYHDSVISEITKRFFSLTQNKNAALVFLSDHGEELYEIRDYAGHGYPPGKVISEVPYFMCLSDKFKKNYPVVEETMRKRLNTPYSTANNFYTVLHLLNINNSGKHKKRILKQGFFSPSYDSTAKRLVAGNDYALMGQ
jgi:heptose-I-phosphate ethanolaminephosphotransferase